METLTLINQWTCTYDPKKSLRILYTNYKGEAAWRRVVPLTQTVTDPPATDDFSRKWFTPRTSSLEFLITPHHQKEQQILHCIDLDKKDYRSFALADIHYILPEEEAARMDDWILNFINRNIAAITKGVKEYMDECGSK